MVEKLNYDDRTERFGIIAKIKNDDGRGEEERRTRVFRKDITPKEKDYRDLMKSGEWLEVHSTDQKNKKWEWGTHYDYLGKGVKLLLFDRIENGITVIADINPQEAFYDYNNYFKVRNVMVGKPLILDKPIPASLVVDCGLKDPSSLGAIPSEEITEKQYNDLMQKYNNWKGK
jgi:hypothetical protein